MQPLDESYYKGQHAIALALATHRLEIHLFRSEIELYINLATGRSPALNSSVLNGFWTKDTIKSLSIYSANLLLSQPPSLLLLVAHDLCRVLVDPSVFFVEVGTSVTTPSFI